MYVSYNNMAEYIKLKSAGRYNAVQTINKKHPMQKLLSQKNQSITRLYICMWYIIFG